MINKKNKIIQVFIFIILSGHFSFSEKFTYKFSEGFKQKIEAAVNGKKYQNKKFLGDYEQYFKTIRVFKEIREDSCIIEDTYYFYNQNKSEKNEISELLDTKTVEYSKNMTGNIKVFDNAFLPTLRNVPVFPDKDIQPGFKWTAAGIEIQEIFGDKVISIFPIEVNYQFIGYETIKNKNLAKFRYGYKINSMNNGNKNIDSRILRISSVVSTVLYFDNELGTPVKEVYDRDYSILINSSEKFTVSFVDSGIREWISINAMKKEDILDQIKDQINRENIEKIEVAKDDRGIKILIEDILFKPDSIEFMSEEKERIGKISDILKIYKDKGILIIGHTALAGKKEDRQKLSVNRAKAIADYLIGQNAVDPAKISILGMGADEPIADNSTEEGKRKNRRVEIFILEE